LRPSVPIPNETGFRHFTGCSSQSAWKIDNYKRYTFAKYKNSLGEISYGFIGVFKVKEKNKEVVIYERISSEIDMR
jgi:hypothetical protein